jgi:hypothetical protein
MTLSRSSAILAMVASLALASTAEAQVAARSPRIGYAYPAGGRQGATFQVKIGGQFLDGASSVFVSGTGVEATVVEHKKPLTPQQANKLREQLMELQQRKWAALGIAGKPGSGGPKGKSKDSAKPAPKTAQPAAWTAEDEKLLVEIRQKLATFVRRPMNPMIAETVVLQVTMAPDAEPGQRELRLGAQLGLSNPIAFCVGELPEFKEKEAAGGPPAAAAKKKAAVKPKVGAKGKAGVKPPSAPVQTVTNITLPATVNGQILPGEADRFGFTGRRGQRLVIAASARQLVPYLPDAVPGWFQATLALFDAKGNELAYDDDYRFDPDPVLYYEIPADGQYVIEIKDAIYRGREDFVYRITVGELPRVTGIFPLGGRTAEKTTVELSGWNLPVDKLVVDGDQKGPGVYPLSVRKEQWTSNRVPFAVDTLPESLEQEPNNEPQRAHRVTPPVIVNGRIDQPGDCDVFRFEGRAGSEIVAEVYARRLGSPLDSFLKLTDATGRQLAANDDHEDKGAGLETHHADSWLSATLPADGTYYLHLTDAQRKGGPEYAYRLRISPPRPDFELRVVPSSINARAGGNVPITVYALRRDGFSGEITLGLKDAPPGFALGGSLVPAGQDDVKLTLRVPTTSQKDPFTLHLEGRATIQGREVSHPAVPAEDMMQAFAYRHLVPAKELRVAVAGRPAPKVQLVRLLSKPPVRIPAGGTARAEIAVPARAMAAQLRLELSDPPEGIAIKSTSPSSDGIDLVLESDAAKVKPGMKGNLIVTAFMRRPGAPGKVKPPAGQRGVPVATLPAVPFEIVAP